MANNKVIYGDQTIMDITDTTAEAADVASGKDFYGKDGVKTRGTANYMDKVSNPTVNDILVTDANGQAVDSGVPISSKMDKVPNATQYNVPQFNENGQVEDSGVRLNDKASVRPTITSSTDWSVYVEQDPGSNTYKGLGVYTTDGLLAVLQAVSGSNQGVIIVPSKGYVDGEISGLANPNKSITINENGQLEVGGRLGQFEGTTGLFAPNNRDPRNVLDYSFLMTDALGVDMSANRAMAVVSGYGIACRSAAAGSTEYRIQNNYQNRILAKCCEGGYASKDEATSTIERIIPVVSVRIGGATYTPDSSANSSATADDIVIKTETTLNPDGAISNIRLFGKMQSYASMHMGNGIRSDSGGRSLVLGGGVSKTGSVNDNTLIGNGIFSSGNGNAAFGRHHICRKNRGFFAGTGHDSTNAQTEGVSAVGQYSYIDSNTLFAVGNGTSQTERSNALEVVSDGIIIKSQNGTRYKLSVSNSGSLAISAV